VLCRLTRDKGVSTVYEIQGTNKKTTYLPVLSMAQQQNFKGELDIGNQHAHWFDELLINASICTGHERHRKMDTERYNEWYLVLDI
jgi:hypothetical protein